MGKLVLTLSCQRCNESATLMNRLGRLVAVQLQWEQASYPSEELKEKLEYNSDCGGDWKEATR